ncbi:MAG: sialate O-acetylesterase [Planctomycetota bacterium]
MRRTPVTLPVLGSLLLLLIVPSVAFAEESVHLFVLSGQSNMQGHRPEEAFTPAVEAAFGKENVLVIQDAQGGQPILRWLKTWRSPDGEQPEKTGDLYDRLMRKVKPAIEGKELASVTFIWMQGERDAKEKWGSVYESSLVGLLKQFSQDIGRDDVNFVIGRLSDFDIGNKRYKDWTLVRKAQVSAAESDPRFDWVNTDDLNDGLNRRGKSIQDDLHYSAEGYKTLGKRFAEKAIALIQQSANE